MNSNFKDSTIVYSEKIQYVEIKSIKHSKGKKSFEIKEDISLLNQFLEQGLSKETHPHSYNEIKAISELIETF